MTQTFLFGLWFCRRTKSHFDLFNNIMLFLCEAQCSWILVEAKLEWKQMKQIPSPIKHITKRNHLRIKTKLFRLNRISPKMPFCFSFNSLLQLLQTKAYRISSLDLIPCNDVFYTSPRSSINVTASCTAFLNQLACKHLSKSFLNDNGTCNSIVQLTCILISSHTHFFCVFRSRY